MLSADRARLPGQRADVSCNMARVRNPSSTSFARLRPGIGSLRPYVPRGGPEVSTALQIVCKNQASEFRE